MKGTDIQILSPKQAWQMISENSRVRLIDVRSHMEFLFVGHPKEAIHISWIDQPEWTINPDFVDEINEALIARRSTPFDNIIFTPIILICRSGIRSIEAGKLLLKHGFKTVYSVEGGFEGDLDDTHRRSTVNGWRYYGLPWEQC